MALSCRYVDAGADWQQYRDLGREPVARGCASFGTCKHLVEVLIDVANRFDRSTRSWGMGSLSFLMMAVASFMTSTLSNRSSPLQESSSSGSCILYLCSPQLFKLFMILFRFRILDGRFLLKDCRSGVSD